MSIQQIIIKGIKEQLFLNSYLVLPGFGGFVLKSNAAHFSGALILPPSKTVSFNAQLKQNDGLLAIWLQAKLNCTNAEALSHLHEFAGFCTGVLNTRRRLSLDTIGFFYLDFENNVCFEPQQDANFLTGSFGLAPVAVKELEPEVVEIKKEPAFADRTLHVEKAADLPKARRSYSRLLVPAALMIVFLSSLLLFVSHTKINGPLKASLFSDNNKSTYTPLIYPQLQMVSGAHQNEAYVADANGVATLSFENDKTIAVKVLNNVVKPEVLKDYKPVYNTTIKNNPGKFEIVLGCFTVLDNAHKMVTKLSKQNIQAFVSGKNAKGMYVVANGSFDNKDIAINKLAEIKGVYPNAWLKQPE